MPNEVNEFYTNNNLLFNYLNLKKHLYNLYIHGIDNVNILLLISLEMNYYEGENLKKIIKDLFELTNNLTMVFEILDEEGNPTGEKTKEIKFKVNKISLDVGDTGNRWKWVYRYNEEYMLKNNLINEEDIPQNIVDEIAIRAYETSKQQGRDWFKEHAIPALNYALSLYDSKIVIPNEFQFTDGIMTILEGNEQIPKIERVCYDHWLNHPNYKNIEKIILAIRNQENSVLEKAYDHEVKYFIKRTGKRGVHAQFPEMFFKYSKIYQFDETMPMVIRHQGVDNNFEFYWFGREPCYIDAFRGKKAQKNEMMQDSLKNELKGILDRNYVAIREKILDSEKLK